MMEGFDYYGVVADFASRWTCSTTTDTQLVTGRFGVGTGKALDMRRVSTQGDARRSFGAVKDELVVGFGFKVTTFANGDKSILYLYNDAGVTIQCALAFNASGQLQVYRGNSGTGTVLATSTLAISTNTWHYIEMKIKIADSGGYAIVRVDDVEFINATSLDTKPSAVTGADQLLVYAMNSGTGSKYYDDIYVCDLTGTMNNDFLGQCRIKYVPPTGDGALQEWDPSAGAGWECVDDSAPDGDATYVLSDSAGDISLFTCDGIAVDDVVLGIDVLAMVKKDDAPERTMQMVIRPDVTDYNGSTTHSLTTGYKYYGQMWETNPETAAQWTPAEIADLQFGMELIT